MGPGLIGEDEDERVPTETALKFLDLLASNNLRRRQLSSLDLGIVPEHTKSLENHTSPLLNLSTLCRIVWDGFALNDISPPPFARPPLRLPRSPSYTRYRTTSSLLAGWTYLYWKNSLSPTLSMTIWPSSVNWPPSSRLIPKHCPSYGSTASTVTSTVILLPFLAACRTFARSGSSHNAPARGGRRSPLGRFRHLSQLPSPVTRPLHRQTRLEKPSLTHTPT